MSKPVFWLPFIFFCLSTSAQVVSNKTSQPDTALRNASAADSSWWPKAVVYEITPHLFTQHTQFVDLIHRLPELQQLGINTIWLQPLFATHHGHQGYDVTDYFHLRKDFGEEADLKKFIDSAHARGMRILFDFVLNHTSIEHPFARDRLLKGSRSAYSNYYQSANDHARYSSHYQIQSNGFVTYFWDDLVNLNFSEPAVRTMILSACRYWVNRMSIDGYRFDAAWAVNARAPDFARELNSNLKQLKPSLLLLAEDKGSVESPYSLGFAAAYDWADDSSWVSHWSWEYDFSTDNSKTIFNYPDVSKRKNLFQVALFGGQMTHLRFRFIENNDTRRFITHHSLQKTKLAAALLFSLPGIPMIYNGQEVGNTLSPYKSGTIFPRGRSIVSINADLFSFYQTLIRLRREHPALTSMYLQEQSSTSGSSISFLRRSGKDKILVCLNLSDSPVTTSVDLSLVQSVSSGQTGFRDLITGDVPKIRQNKSILTIELPADGILLIPID